MKIWIKQKRILKWISDMKNDVKLGGIAQGKWENNFIATGSEEWEEK